MKMKDFNLRPIRITDAKGYFECHRDKDAKLNFSSIPKTLLEAKKEIQKDKKYNKRFAIIFEGKFAGFVNLRLNYENKYKHSAIVGYGIHKNFRRGGLATQALKRVTDYGFRKLKLKRISGMCRTFNKASARVLEKAGYRCEGTLHKNKFINGRYYDDMIWAKWK